MQQRTSRRSTEATLKRIFLALALTSAAMPAANAQWTAPTQEELLMTSLPQAPGAPAVYLLRDENTDDRQRLYTEYVRLKVLTDGGKDRANAFDRVRLECGEQVGIGSVHGKRESQVR